MSTFNNSIFMGSLSEILISIVAIAIAITVHEFGHALSAYLLGDKTSKYDGRLSLDPMRHIDPIGVICFAVLGFGWARPVQIDSSNFKNSKLGIVLVSLSGAIGNVVMAIICVYIIKLNGFGMESIVLIAWKTLMFNVSFAAFNLLPIPPLDGWSIISSLIPYKYREYVYKYESMSYMILFICLITGIHSVIYVPIHNVLMSIVSIFMM